MHISRRGLLAATVALPLGLAGCSFAAAITFTEQVLSDIQNIEAALGNVVPASLEATINGYLTDVDNFLKNLNVGGLVPPVTATAIFSDLNTALQDVAALLPGNPIVMAAQVVLAAVAAVWGATGPNLARAGAPDLDAARATLAALPRHVSAV